MVGNSQTRIYLKIYNTYCEYWSFKILTVVKLCLPSKSDSTKTKIDHPKRQNDDTFLCRFVLFPTLNIFDKHLISYIFIVTRVSYYRSFLVVVHCHSFCVRWSLRICHLFSLCVCLFCVLCYKHKQTAKFVKATVP